MKASVPLLLGIYVCLGIWCTWDSVIHSNPYGLKATGGKYEVKWDPFRQRTVLIQKNKGLTLTEKALQKPLVIQSDIPGSTVLVRVIGSTPSDLGELLMPIESQSRIAVINPNGVFVGPDADLSRLFPESSSTLDTNGEAFQNRHALLIQEDGKIRAVEFPAVEKLE